MKEMNKLISIITKMEGKKSSVSVGNVREVINILRGLSKNPEHFSVIVRYLLK